MHGFFWNREMSIFYKEEDNTLDWSIVLGLVLMSMCKFGGFCCVILTFSYALKAGMNIGIITVIFNFCCVTDSIVFYFIFKEKLTKAQLVGSLILISSAYFIS